MDDISKSQTWSELILNFCNYTLFILKILVKIVT